MWPERRLIGHYLSFPGGEYLNVVILVYEGKGNLTAPCIVVITFSVFCLRRGFSTITFQSRITCVTSVAPGFIYVWRGDSGRI